MSEFLKSCEDVKSGNRIRFGCGAMQSCVPVKRDSSCWCFQFLLFPRGAVSVSVPLSPVPASQPQSTREEIANSHSPETFLISLWLVLSVCIYIYTCIYIYIYMYIYIYIMYAQIYISMYIIQVCIYIYIYHIFPKQSVAKKGFLLVLYRITYVFHFFQKNRLGWQRQPQGSPSSPRACIPRIYSVGRSSPNVAPPFNAFLKREPLLFSKCLVRGAPPLSAFLIREGLPPSLHV